MYNKWNVSFLLVADNKIWRKLIFFNENYLKSCTIKIFLKINYQIAGTF